MNKSAIYSTSYRLGYCDNQPLWYCLIIIGITKMSSQAYVLAQEISNAYCKK